MISLMGVVERFSSKVRELTLQQHRWLPAFLVFGEMQKPAIARESLALQSFIQFLDQFRLLPLVQPGVRQF